MTAPLELAQIGRPKAARLPRELRLAALASALTIAIATLAAGAVTIVFIPTIGQPQFVWLTAFFFRTQDMFWLAVVAALLAGLALAPLPAIAARATSLIERWPRATLAVLAVCVFAAAAAGVHVVFGGYDLARDEVLADFDAVIFRSGRLVAPVAAQWQHFAAALAPNFMLPIAGGAGFVSAYLPVNAGFRAIVGLVASPEWTSPLLAATAVVATFGAARRLWPGRPDAALIATLLVATSPQVLVTAMTSYAMTAHLALNMIWLWLFLRDDRIGHGAAIGVGFLACGLHQLIFHPLFAAPFILRLRLSQRRGLALVYIVSYAAICVFWISYWRLVLAGQGLLPQVSDPVGPAFFIIRAEVLLRDFHWQGADLMLKNLLRFADWQNPALLPLAVLAYHAVRRGSGSARELAAGFLLTVTVMFILLPYQGHGWGYRYVHGCIGSLALLGGCGWIHLTERASREEIGACRALIAICGAAACLVLLPAHAWQAHDFAMPYVRAAASIAQAPTDVVVVDPSRLLFAEDLVRNDPFLRNRPKVLDLSELTAPDISALCARHTVAIFGYHQALAFGIAPNDQATAFGDAARARSRAEMARPVCGSGR